MVFMDQNGDAEGNYSLIARKNRNDVIGMFPIGVFLMPSNSSDIPVETPESFATVFNPEFLPGSELLGIS